MSTTSGGGARYSGAAAVVCVVSDHTTRDQFGHRVAAVIIAVLAPALGGMVLRRWGIDISNVVFRMHR
jgi:hypothetical protein